MKRKSEEEKRRDREIAEEFRLRTEKTSSNPKRRQHEVDTPHISRRRDRISRQRSRRGRNGRLRPASS